MTMSHITLASSRSYDNIQFSDYHSSSKNLLIIEPNESVRKQVHSNKDFNLSEESQNRLKFTESESTYIPNNALSANALTTIKENWNDEESIVTWIPDRNIIGAGSQDVQLSDSSADEIPRPVTVHSLLEPDRKKDKSVQLTSDDLHSASQDMAVAASFVCDAFNEILACFRLVLFLMVAVTAQFVKKSCSEEHGREPEVRQCKSTTDQEAQTELGPECENLLANDVVIDQNLRESRATNTETSMTANEERQEMTVTKNHIVTRENPAVSIGIACDSSQYLITVSLQTPPLSTTIHQVRVEGAMMTTVTGKEEESSWTGQGDGRSSACTDSGEDNKESREKSQDCSGQQKQAGHGNNKHRAAEGASGGCGSAGNNGNGDGDDDKEKDHRVTDEDEDYDETEEEEDDEDDGSQNESFDSETQEICGPEAENEFQVVQHPRTNVCLLCPSSILTCLDLHFFREILQARQARPIQPQVSQNPLLHQTALTHARLRSSCIATYQHNMAIGIEVRQIFVDNQDATVCLILRGCSFAYDHRILYTATAFLLRCNNDTLIAILLIHPVNLPNGPANAFSCALNFLNHLPSHPVSPLNFPVISLDRPTALLTHAVIFLAHPPTFLDRPTLFLDHQMIFLYHPSNTLNHVLNFPNFLSYVTNLRSHSMSLLNKPANLLHRAAIFTAHPAAMLICLSHSPVSPTTFQDNSSTLLGQQVAFLACSPAFVTHLTTFLGRPAAFLDHSFIFLGHAATFLDCPATFSDNLNFLNPLGNFLSHQANNLPSHPVSPLINSANLLRHRSAISPAHPEAFPGFLSIIIDHLSTSDHPTIFLGHPETLEHQSTFRTCSKTVLTQPTRNFPIHLLNLLGVVANLLSSQNVRNIPVNRSANFWNSAVARLLPDVCGLQRELADDLGSCSGDIRFADTTNDENLVNIATASSKTGSTAEYLNGFEPQPGTSTRPSSAEEPLAAATRAAAPPADTRSEHSVQIPSIPKVILRDLLSCRDEDSRQLPPNLHMCVDNADQVVEDEMYAQSSTEPVEEGDEEEETGRGGGEGGGDALGSEEGDLNIDDVPRTSPSGTSMDHVVESFNDGLYAQSSTEPVEEGDEEEETGRGGGEGGGDALGSEEGDLNIDDVPRPSPSGTSMDQVVEGFNDGPYAQSSTEPVEEGDEEEENGRGEGEGGGDALGVEEGDLNIDDVPRPSPSGTSMPPRLTMKPNFVLVEKCEDDTEQHLRVEEAEQQQEAEEMEVGDVLGAEGGGNLPATPQPDRLRARRGLTLVAQCEEDVLEARHRQLQEENRRLQEPYLCPMCRDRMYNQLLLPCTHRVCDVCRRRHAPGCPMCFLPVWKYVTIRYQ